MGKPPTADPQGLADLARSMEARLESLAGEVRDRLGALERQAAARGERVSAVAGDVSDLADSHRSLGREVADVRREVAADRVSLAEVLTRMSGDLRVLTERQQTQEQGLPSQRAGGLVDLVDRHPLASLVLVVALLSTNTLLPLVQLYLGSP
jgi:hypothetical protein